MPPQRTAVIVYSAVLISLTGCSLKRQDRFQSSLVPAGRTSMPDSTVDLPKIPPSFQWTDTPGFLLEQPRVSQPSRADALAVEAERHFQSGSRLARSGSPEEARKEFDRAVDLMLEAMEDPLNRRRYDNQFDQMVTSIHRSDLTRLDAAMTAEDQGFEKPPLEDIVPMTFPVDPKLKDRVKDQVQATVSQLPLDVNDAVLGYLNFFSGRGRKTLIAGLQRAGQYRPMIQRILDEEGVPQELIHLAQAESGFFPRAVSRMRAAGMWQFMAFRGLEYGLTQTKFTDDRLDPEKSTRAAARHLRDLYERLGDWYLAMAAYNCGPLAVEQAIQRTGYADFWELRRRGVLPRETANYVPVIVAMTIMAKNPAEYGLQDVRPLPGWDYETVEIVSPTHLALVADLTESTPGQLQALNPSLLKAVAPAGCDLRVPRGTASSLVTMLQTIPPESRSSWRVHRVEYGDTLATIGRRYATAPDSIATANKLTSQEVTAGDLLVVPAIYREPKPAAPRKVARKQSGKRPAQPQRLAKSGAPVKPRAAARPGTKRPASLGQTASNHRTPATSKTAVRR